MSVIHNFYIHPQTQETLQGQVLKVNGIPALYTFEWSCKFYKPPYQLTTTAEGTSLEDAAENATKQILGMGVNPYDDIELTLIKLENKIYQMNRNTISAKNNL